MVKSLAQLPAKLKFLSGFQYSFVIIPIKTMIRVFFTSRAAHLLNRIFTFILSIKIQGEICHIDL